MRAGISLRGYIGRVRFTFELEKIIGPIKGAQMKNIILDLGRVLIDFRPQDFLYSEFETQKAERLLKAIFGNPKWAEFDLGKISQKNLIEAIVVESGLEPYCVEKVFYLLPTLLRPIEENCALLEELSSRYTLYVLSNFPKEPFESLLQFSFFKHFSGRVVSYEVGVKKPEKAIYEKIVSKYNLVPCETLFIDDSLENIEMAQRCGIHAHQLTDPTLFKDLLKSINVIE